MQGVSLEDPLVIEKDTSQLLNRAAGDSLDCKHTHLLSHM